MLKAIVLSNGIEGLESIYRSNHLISYSFVQAEGLGTAELSAYDLFIAPNGTDHVALYRAKEKIKAFLDQGKAVCCFDGWFTNWVPANRWVMDNSRKSIDIRYKIKNDPYGLHQKFSCEELSFSHGISGWWACGYIAPSPQATIVMEDTFSRPILVVDEGSTAGLLVLTASGPLGDFTYATTDDEASNQAVSNLYQAILELIQQKLSKRYANA